MACHFFKLTYFYQYRIWNLPEYIIWTLVISAIEMYVWISKFFQNTNVQPFILHGLILFLNKLLTPVLSHVKLLGWGCVDTYLTEIVSSSSVCLYAPSNWEKYKTNAENVLCIYIWPKLRTAHKCSHSTVPAHTHHLLLKYNGKNQYWVFWNSF